MKKRIRMFLPVLVTLAMVVSLFSMAIPASASEIQLAKDTTEPSGPNYYYPGDTIHYKMTVTNPSGNDYTNYLDFVEDILPDGSNVTLATNVTQAPGVNNTYYQDYVVDENDLVFSGGRWRVVNTLHVEGTDSSQDIIDATTSKSSIILRPSINITKTVDFDDDGVYTDLETNVAGQNASWNITVCNNGYDPVYDIVVTDTNGNDFGAVFNLTVGECKTFTYDEEINAAKVNNATAVGYDDLGNPVGPVSDPAEVRVADARISIAPNATNPVGMAHNFTVTVEKDEGSGWVAADGVTVNASLTGVGSIISSGPYITDGSGEVTVTVNSSVAGIANLDASATVNASGVDIDVDTDGYGAFVVDNEKDWVDARISITPSDTNKVGDPHTFTIHVEENDGTGWADADGETVVPSIASGPAGASITSTGPYTTDGNGEVEVTVNSTDPGTLELDATCAVSVGGITVDVDTDGYGALTVENEKTWVDARISIEESGTNPVNTPHTFNVTVEINDGDGWDPAVGVNVTPWLAMGSVGSITSSGPYITDGSGQVMVTVNSATAGTATVHASATVNVGGIDIAVATDGYGAYYVSNVKEWEEEGDEGCTPGFWKNNARNKGASAWVGYAPGDSFECVFGVDVTLRGKGKNTYPAPTLLQALDANGGGINALARHAVAALLNIANPDIAYGIGSTGALITMVHDAIVSGDEAQIDALHVMLAGYNEAGCPLNQRGEPAIPD